MEIKIMTTTFCNEIQVYHNKENMWHNCQSIASFLVVANNIVFTTKVMIIAMHKNSATNVYIL